MSTEILTQKIQPILEKYGATEAQLFGSFARGEERPESDVDLVVSLDKPIGVYRFLEFKEALEGVLGRSVDLLSKRAINKNLRSFIDRDLVTIYER